MLDAEPIAVDPYDRRRRQVAARAGEDGAGWAILNQDEAQRMVKLKSPQEVDAVVTDVRQLPVHLDSCRDEAVPHRIEQGPELDAVPFAAWTPLLPRFPGRRGVVGGAGLPRPRDQFQRESALAPFLLPCDQGRDGQEIAVHRKDGIACKLPGDLIGIPDDLDDVGLVGRIGVLPSSSLPQPVVEAEAGGDAGEPSRETGQDADAAPHVAEDALRLGLRLRLLVHALHAGHPPSLLGLLDPIGGQEESVGLPADRDVTQDGAVPATAHGGQVPSVRMEEMEKGMVGRGAQGKIPHDGGDAEPVRSQHQAEHDGTEPGK